MNFLQTFETAFKTYLAGFTPSSDGNLPLTFTEYLRNDLRNKHMSVFANQENETILCRYKGNKAEMDWNNPLIRNGRSIIFDLQTLETLMVAPIKSLMIDDFKAKYQTLENVLIEDFPSGPMINMYYHIRKGWQIATRSYVGANNNFRSNEKSFATLFTEALKKTTNLTLEEFGANLDINNTFSFVLTHPEYFDVARYAEPSIILVEVRERTQDHFIVGKEPVKEYFESKGWTIKFPKVYTFSTWSEVDKFISTQPSQEQGLEFSSGSDRAKIRNPEFLVSRKLLGNHSKLVDVFAENLQNKSVNDFLTYFPEKTNEFHHYITLYQEICGATHAFYIAHNTRPAGNKIEFSEIPRPIQTSVWNIHKQYLESGTNTESRRPVKPNVVDNYYRNLPSIELANVLTYWDNHIKNQKNNTTNTQTIEQSNRPRSTYHNNKKKTPQQKKDKPLLDNYYKEEVVAKQTEETNTAVATTTETVATPEAN